MSLAAFGLIVFMLAVYVLLDGYDLGVAAITPLIARSSQERHASMDSIGPFWNGNEVWLIAAGGALFALFPKAYASSFSGFYLPFSVVLWLLMFRGISLALRNHFSSELWQDVWDFSFAASSVLLILLLGVAVGNLLRGVPLDPSGYFNGTFGFLLNPYAIGVGVFAILALMLHGTAFLPMRVDGPPARRAVATMRVVGPLTIAAYIGMSIATHLVHPAAFAWWLYTLPCLSFLSLIAMLFANAKSWERAAFGTSCVFLVTLIAEAAAAMYPYIVPAYPQTSNGISIYSIIPDPIAFTTFLFVTAVGVAGVVIYGTIAFRGFLRDKIRVD